VLQLAQNYGGTWPDLGALNVNNLNHINPTAGIGDPFNLGSGVVQQPVANPFNQAAFFVDPTGYKMPYSDQWNFDVEGLVGRQTMVSLSYAGAHSLQLNQGGYQNVARADPRTGRCGHSCLTAAIPLYQPYVL
jgi:hypothetical protein